jgi:hypothetical protein
MRGFELAAELAAPWPLALVIDSVVKEKPLSGSHRDLASSANPTEFARELRRRSFGHDHCW